MVRITGRRLRWPCLAILAGAALSSAAQTQQLSLAEAQQLAVEHQPLLQSETDRAAAARERAVAAGQLPDPELKLGVTNVPVDTADAWRLNRDSMTQTTVGLSQDIPLPGKRTLRAQVESLNALSDEAQLAAIRRAVRRDAGLAYLDLLHPHHAAALVKEQIAEADLASKTVRIAYRTGQRGQADVLATRANLAMLEDKAASYEQQLDVARENLQRWIGNAADVVPEEPAAPPLPPLADLLASLAKHPELIAADRSIDRAEAEKQLAKKARQPDLNVEVDYGYRSDYSDMVSLQVGIPLPLFTHQRQDRGIAAAQAELDAEQAQRDDLGRRLAAQLAANYREWQALSTRIERFDRDVLPPLSGRVDAALADYRAGSGRLDAVLDARQALLDGQLSELELHLQRLRAAVQLHYFAPDE